MPITSPYERTLARKAAGLGAYDRCPVELANAPTEAPHVVGGAGYYTTRAGVRVEHPNAYSRRGFSNLIHHRSTRRVLVGAEWLLLAV